MLQRQNVIFALGIKYKYIKYVLYIYYEWMLIKTWFE